MLFYCHNYIWDVLHLWEAISEPTLYRALRLTGSCRFCFRWQLWLHFFQPKKNYKKKTNHIIYRALILSMINICLGATSTLEMRKTEPQTIKFLSFCVRKAKFQCTIGYCYGEYKDAIKSALQKPQIKWVIKLYSISSTDWIARFACKARKWNLIRNALV